MIADMRVLELGDLTLLNTDPATRNIVIDRLERFIFSEDVQLRDLGGDLAQISVCGPASPGVVTAVLDDRPPIEPGLLAILPEYSSLRGCFQGAAALVTAERDLGVAGFDIYLERGLAGALILAAKAAGADPVAEATAEVLRIEAGRPRWGADMDEETIPLEAGLEGRAVSFTKGCFPGQEVIVRIRDRGHGKVARKLVGLAFEGSEVPSPGDAVAAGGREIGRVTSAVFSPAAGGPIALSYLHRDFTAAGTGVTVARGDRLLAARVAALPFVSPAP
jgi:folate-binding protein YgfZ